LLKLQDAEWLLRECVVTAERVMPEETSADELADAAQTLFIEAAPWKIQKESFNPEDAGLALPKYRWLTNQAGEHPPLVTKPQVKAAVIGLGKLFTEDERKAFLKRMFGVDSTNDLNGHQAGAIIDWVGATEKNGWRPSLVAVVEAGLVREVL
jgi:hypothetical protein